jgi:hypothetical protein
MRRIIIFIIFLISIFIINLVFYFISDDYRFFLKKIKNRDDVIYLDEKTYDDKEIINNNKILDNAERININKNNDKIFNLEKNN